MNIPSRDDCFQLMCAMRMLEHIVAHSLQVCRVATGLVDHLILEGISLDRYLVQAAALLHDITKTRSFKTEENHALTGAQYLTDSGYPEVGNLVRQHVRLDDYSEANSLAEAKIINYADKRVLHDRIVPLEERMNYIMRKYATLPEHERRIRLLWAKTNDLEKQIFRYLPFSPNNLDARLPSPDITDEMSNYQKLCSRPANGRP